MATTTVGATQLTPELAPACDDFSAFTHAGAVSATQTGAAAARPTCVGGTS